MLGYIETITGPYNKKSMDWAYQLMKNVGYYGCLAKTNCQLKSLTMARNTFKLRRGR